MAASLWWLESTQPWGATCSAYCKSSTEKEANQHTCTHTYMLTSTHIHEHTHKHAYTCSHTHTHAYAQSCRSISTLKTNKPSVSWSLNMSAHLSILSFSSSSSLI
jgi:ABC-type nickel/cobalt efflux system permease component RcnA